MISACSPQYVGALTLYLENGIKEEFLTKFGEEFIPVSDDEALDDILDWESGTFTISPKEISFQELIGVETVTTKVDNIAVIVSNSLVVRRLLEKKIQNLDYKVKTAKFRKMQLKVSELQNQVKGLKNQIDQLKSVDIRIEEKKRKNGNH